MLSIVSACQIISGGVKMVVLYDVESLGCSTIKAEVFSSRIFVLTWDAQGFGKILFLMKMI